MTDWDAWGAKRVEFGFVLQRRIWQPLRSMMEIFHVLPLVAAVILFVLLATDGQLREIYIAYLEGSAHDTVVWAAGIVAALAIVALISAVLYEAHLSLSTMRLNVIYSTSSNPEAGSKLRSLQRAAAFVLAFVPWLGLTIGLFGARMFVADRYCQLVQVAHVQADLLHGMQYLTMANGWTIAGAVCVLGLTAAYFAAVGEQGRIAQRAVALVAPPLWVLLFLLFTDRLNTDRWTTGATKFCAIAAVITVFYFWFYQKLYRRRSGFIFPSAGTGVSLRKRRRRWLAVWAFAPWFFMAVYLAAMEGFAQPAHAADYLSRCPVSAAGAALPNWLAIFHAAWTLPVRGQWAIFPVAMCMTVAIGLLVGHVLGQASTSKWRRWAVVGLVAALGVVVVGFSFLGGIGATVSVYRFLGPLGTVSLELLFLISTFAVLAVLSQRSGFPALTLVILTVVVCVMFPNYAGLTAAALGIAYLLFAGMAFVSGRTAVGIVALLLTIVGGINFYKLNTEPPGRQITAQKTDSSTVRVKFLCWLDHRGIPAVRTAEQTGNCPADANRPTVANKYAVFVVAAEGGGIYAASAAATFLAKLEDSQPDFAEHIFAISGVSGGSIGAAIFQAFDHAEHPDPVTTTGALPVKEQVSTIDDGTTCIQYPAAAQVQSHKSLTDEVMNVMQDDHFSPIVGAIFPEILGARLTRPKALIASFEYSTSAQDPAAGKELCAPFSQHWAPDSAVPALVLNSTWVETGFRVAFAPFHLHDLDESLYSFSDPEMPDEHTTNLMGAASVSARFPLIMPPLSVLLKDQKAGTESLPGKAETKRWNFVDGAYSDNSGATTAIDLYRVLDQVIKSVAAQNDVVLRVIFITSANPQPNLKDRSINGTVFRDTVAPIDALMKVRSDLGNDAVARACTAIYQTESRSGANTQAPTVAGASGKEANETCIDHAGGEDAVLQIVEIQDQTYGLSLGWKISQTSLAVVSWMLGTPDNCPGRQAQKSNVASSLNQGSSSSQQDANTQLTDVILKRNSCVLDAMVDLVRNPAQIATAPAPAGAVAQ
jgi:hypothetical protein